MLDKQAAPSPSLPRAHSALGIISAKVCGIYAIICTVTGEMYVGSSVDVRRRWRQHRNRLRRGTSTSRKLQDAWSEHPEHFSFALLFECAEADLHAQEQVWFERLKPSLNLDGKAGSSLGRRLTAEQREKLKRRPQSQARRHLYRGEMLTVPEIAAQTGMHEVTLYARLRTGVPLERELPTRGGQS